MHVSFNLNHNDREALLRHCKKFVAETVSCSLPCSTCSRPVTFTK